MELSDSETDSEGPGRKKPKTCIEDGQLSTVKEENDSLKCQLEAYRNETEMVKIEAKQNAEVLEKQITSLQNALKGMQQQLIAQQQARRSLSQDNPKPDHEDKSLSSEDGKDKDDSDADIIFVTRVKAPEPVATIRSQDSSVSSSGVQLSDKEARILGLISCFLNVHPHGATVDYLWSYLSQMMAVRPREIEDLLDRLPSLFRQSLAGCGATLERRWCFVGYQKEKATST